MTSVQGLATGGGGWIWVRAFIWITITVGTDISGSAPTSSLISTEEFLEPRGTDHPAPQETAGGAGAPHGGELLGEAIPACGMAWESHVLSGLVQPGKGC